MKTSITKFDGIRPKQAIHLLAETEAQTAQNVRIDGGDLRPLYADVLAATLNDRSLVRSIFLYESSHWLAWPADVDVVTGPIEGDTTNRFYFTGDGIPKKSNETEATVGGTGDKPYNFYPIGVPSPLTAPTAVNGGAEAGDVVYTAYLWTIITSWGEESAPSPVSDILTTKTIPDSDLSGMTIVWQAGTAYTTDNWIVPSVLGDYVYKCVTAGTTGGSEPDWGTTVDEDTTDGTCEWRCYKKAILFTSGVKRIYRVNTGDVTAIYQMVVDIAMTATTYTDTKTDAQLESTYLQSEGWSPPPDGMTGIVSMGQYFAGISGKTIRLSEANYVHAWPDEYGHTISSNPVALIPIDGALLVLTDNKPVVMVGVHPSAMVPGPKAKPAACLSKRGAVHVPGGAVYPTAMGLEFNNGSSSVNITEQAYSRREWTLLYPGTFNACYHENKYYGFYSSGGTEGGIIVDMGTGMITTLDFYAQGVFVDEATDTMYYLTRQTLVRITEAGTPWPSRTGARLTEAGDYRLVEG